MERWRSLFYLLATILLIRLDPAAAQRPAPRPRAFRPITDESVIRRVASLSDSRPVLEYTDPGSLLARILIPRTPGSQNLTKCRELFRAHFDGLVTRLRVPDSAHLYDALTHEPLREISTWALEEHRFTDKTPYGEQEFTNMVFTHDPTAPLKLVIAAHIDSKYFPTHPADQFVGATDSAAPTAMVLEAARALTPLLNAQLKERLNAKNGPQEERVTLQVILLDGEEAYQQWTASDSIYGARALAMKWSQIQRPPNNFNRGRNTLDTIQTFILLDLLGAADPWVQNYYAATTWLYDSFAAAEHRLGAAGVLWPGQSGAAWATAQATKGRKKGRAFFRPHPVHQTSFFGGIEDDHIPFLRRGVPILHLIAFPFPRVWHTLADDASALDLPTIRAWTLILELALAEYFGLEPYLGEDYHPRTHPDLVSRDA